MSQNDRKDFFISYAEVDRSWAEWVAWHLEAVKHTCILEAWDFRPGSISILKVDEALKQAERVIVVLSPVYLSDANVQFIWANARRRDPTGERGILLPVYVRECQPEGLLGDIIPINLFDCHEADARTRLLFGIQPGRMKPAKSPEYPGLLSHPLLSPLPDFPGKSNILIASLGDSPAVISSMYDQLTKEENLSIDQVVVLCPKDDKDEDIKHAYELVQKAFSRLIAEERLMCEWLQFQDANSWEHCCTFLKDLYVLLCHHQREGNTVYLSLAGGRKSMSALMAWVVPFFSCIGGLYHIIDKEVSSFRPVSKITGLTGKQFERVMHPSCEQVKLVDIPFEREEQLSWDMRRKLTSASPSELIKGEYEVVEAQIVGRIATRGEESLVLKVQVTEEAKQQFELLKNQYPETGRLVRNGLLTLSDMSVLLDELQEAASVKLDGSRKAKVLRYFKGLGLSVRPVFYTEPHDLAKYPDKEINKVVICALEQEEGGTYKSLQKVKASKDSSAASDLLPPPERAESVLIVPLGIAPMMATQLYTLLKEREQRTIRALVLIYPQSQQILNGVKIIERILPHEVHFEKAEVEDYKDIDSREACSAFQRVLEKKIEWARDKYHGCKIDVALSGGRKGMTAMTIFAAQRKNIPFVYHTLIADDDLSEEIEKATTIEKLNEASLTEEQLKARLFLDEYSSPDEQPYRYSCFKLFRVPVFPIEG
jgi:CRISPR-associated Csx14 family protein